MCLLFQCVENSLELPESTLTFLRVHPEMERSVHDERPIVFERDTLFKHIQIDVVAMSGRQYIVMFLATGRNSF